MTTIIDYFLLLTFIFVLTITIFLGFKAIKLI